MRASGKRIVGLLLLNPEGVWTVHHSISSLNYIANGGGQIGQQHMKESTAAATRSYTLVKHPFLAHKSAYKFNRTLQIASMKKSKNKNSLTTGRCILNCSHCGHLSSLSPSRFLEFVGPHCLMQMVSDHTHSSAHCIGCSCSHSS